MSPKCPQCEAVSDEGDQFCPQCGAKLKSELDSTISFTISLETGEETHVDLDQLSQEGPLLIVVKGAGVGQTFPIRKTETLIGRDPLADIFLDDVTVSRAHAKIRKKNDGHELEDVGSLNGTYLNRDRVDTATLRGRDELQIGKFKMIYLDAAGD